MQGGSELRSFSFTNEKMSTLLSINYEIVLYLTLFSPYKDSNSFIWPRLISGKYEIN